MREPVAHGLSLAAVRTPTLPPATHTNAVLLGAREVVVVDPASPYPEEQEALAGALADLKVSAIVLTHHHVDHVSGAEDLRRRTGAPILAHPITAELVDFDVDQTLDEGGTLDVEGVAWRALHTPGHAPGHLCLHADALGLAVVGDMVAGVGTIVLDPPHGDLGAYLASLERLRALGTSTLVPAHGPALTAPEAVLSYYIEHRHNRTAQVLAALRTVGAAARPAELVPHIYPELSAPLTFVAARQVLCHLQWLSTQGRAHEHDGGRWTLE